MGSGLIQYFLDKSIFVNLLTILILMVGAFTATTMNREAFPNIDFDIVSVTTIYPGASPADVEKLVTKPLEDAILEVDGLKEFRSASLENRSGIIITIDPNVSDTDKVVDDIKSAVDRVTDLPDDAEDPLVTEITTARQPVIELDISANTKDGKVVLTQKELKDRAKILEERLKNLPGVARIVKRGWNDAEMHVDLKPEVMSFLSISSTQIVTALKNKNINFPGGNITGSNKEIIVRTVGEFDKPEEIEKVYIRTNDASRSILLKDVAKVSEDFVESEYLDKANGFTTIALTVVKREKADAITVVDEAKAIVDDFLLTYKEDVSVAFVNDLSKFIRRRLGVLLSNAVTGLILVTASLFVFLGWRMAIMTALGIPISFGMAFIAMNYLGVTLNLISMLGLIIVIGIIVDDAIIICENVYRYIEKGVPAYEAALRGTTEVVAPVTATITTTVAAFAPMLFMTGIFGKFIRVIPLVVILSLVSSLFEALFILPSHLYDISKKSNMQGEIKEESGTFHNFKSKVYLPILAVSLRNKYKTVLILVMVLIFSLIVQVFLGKFKLFPGAIETFQVKITGETGLSLEAMETFTKALEKEIDALEPGEVENYITRVGIIQKDPNDPFTKRGKNFAQIMVYLTPDDDRERSTEEIINIVRDKTVYLLNEKALALRLEAENRERENLKKKGKEVPEAVSFDLDGPKEFSNLRGQLVNLEFEKLAGGPPVGKPIAIEIKGDDFATLQAIASEYKAVLSQIEGITDIGDDFVEGKDEVRVYVDESLASFAGVSVIQIATAINTAYQGTVATKIKRADEEVDVRVRFPQAFRNSLDSLKNIFVNNLAGNLIPVSKLIRYERSPGRASINHLDGKRLITVTANLDESVVTPREANAKAIKLSKNIIDKFPGYTSRFSGENKDTEESLASLGRAFLVGLLIIFMILASLFRSILQPFIVMSAIPFSIIGVIIAFAFHGESFSFLAFLGVVGLAGVVVNDSIVLVDCANGIRNEHPEKSIYEILIETGSIRLRAVVLTTVTTVLGLLPTAYGIGGKDPFLVPMALAFGWGLVFASVITLIVVPVFYRILFDSRVALSKLLGRFKKTYTG
ncbi:efflux RND transporter permease subunit [Leptospira sp. GIMC2001]|uniref:efflux RND transporter permease subunit n=1 Tax=Leptospira sp. GIMC2001 TaxID=1513297 RepID=UPI0004A5C30B|nr:efflux RND transporter permease subunit [Leptospira sp. GIMC2001]AID56174.1 acriflavine resistance-like protein [Leptospira sp. GIMC2001]WCL47838.1 efflux RND transporter permease subunit [Leptospira sp. GIMC2001]